MPFIGNQPALSYTSFAKQDFSTSATTTYTLDNPVANANELALFINFVRQEPTTAYSASGTTLTLTEATSSSDDMYCVYLGKAVQTVNPPNASVGTSQLADNGVTTAKIANDAVTKDKVSNLMYPAFAASLSANQTIADNTIVKIQINTEAFDSDNCYDSSTNYRFTPTVAGRYVFYGNIRTSAGDGQNASTASYIYKNGSIAAQLQLHTHIPSEAANISAGNLIILEANGSTDYFEFFGICNDTSGNAVAIGSTSYPITYFGAYRIGD